jgi:HEAT repeat protein
VTGCVIESIPVSPEKVTERLIPLLEDPQPDTRRTAALSLGKIGDPQSIPALVSALSDPDDEVREWSAWALGTMADSLSEHALVALVQCITDPSDSVKQAVVLALGRTTIPEELMQVLTEAYSISTIPTQRTIIQALSHFEFPSSYALFLQALQSPDHLTRQSAIAGLGELGDPRGLPILRTHLLQDKNVGVRSEAAFRLGKLGSSADVRALRQAMETDPTPTVHFWASWALGQIGQDT